MGGLTLLPELVDDLTSTTPNTYSESEFMLQDIERMHRSVVVLIDGDKYFSPGEARYSRRYREAGLVVVTNKGRAFAPMSCIDTTAPETGWYTLRTLGIHTAVYLSRTLERTWRWGFDPSVMRLCHPFFEGMGYWKEKDKEMESFISKTIEGDVHKTFIDKFSGINNHVPTDFHIHTYFLTIDCRQTIEEAVRKLNSTNYPVLSVQINREFALSLSPHSASEALLWYGPYPVAKISSDGRKLLSCKRWTRSKVMKIIKGLHLEKGGIL